MSDVVTSGAVFVPAIMPTGLTFSEISTEIASDIANVLNEFTSKGVEVWLRFAHEMNYYVTPTSNSNADGPEYPGGSKQDPSDRPSPERCSDKHDSADRLHCSLAKSPRCGRKQPQDPHVLVSKFGLGKWPQRLVPRPRLRRYRRHGCLPWARCHICQHLRWFLQYVCPRKQQALLHRRNRCCPRWFRREQRNMGYAACKYRIDFVSLLQVCYVVWIWQKRGGLPHCWGPVCLHDWGNIVELCLMKWLICCAIQHRRRNRRVRALGGSTAYNKLFCWHLSLVCLY